MTLRWIRPAHRRSALALTISAFTSLSLVLACGDDEDTDKGSKSQTGGESNEGGAGGSGGSATGGKSSGGVPGAGGLGGSGLGGAETGGAATGGAATGGTGATFPTLVVAEPDEIADKSYPEYGDNQHGLITGGRLKTWYEDWENNKPDGITGRLIVLQIVPTGVISFEHLAPKEDEGVFTYLIAAGDLAQARNNGISAFETDIPEGALADAFLKKYGIDPRKDLIVLNFEQQKNTTNTVVQSIGRAWILLRYWGVGKEHIGILNGSINWNATGYGLPLVPVAQQKFSKPKNDGTTTVRDLGADNTALVISAEEIIAILKGEDENVDPSKVRIVDARGGAEALGLQRATSTGRKDCLGYVADDATTSGVNEERRCSTPFEGRIRTAKSVPWTQFIDTAANGLRFLPYGQLKNLFDTQSGYNASSELTIQYCRTNQRSTVTGIVAAVILGYPTRFYETSFIEWGHLAYGPTANTQILPESSPYRADVPDDVDTAGVIEALTEHAVLSATDEATYAGIIGSSASTSFAPTEPVTWVAGPNYNINDHVAPKGASWPPVNTSATTTNQSVITDRAYLRGE